jgi:flagellar hook-length control protein FliK
MQAQQLLPIPELSAIDVSALAAAPASPATKKLAAAFAELLGENLETPAAPPVTTGARLPESGNILPVPPASESDALPDPEQIVASLQRELEGLAAEEPMLTETRRDPDAELPAANAGLENKVAAPEQSELPEALSPQLPLNAPVPLPPPTPALPPITTPIPTANGAEMRAPTSIKVGEFNADVGPHLPGYSNPPVPPVPKEMGTTVIPVNVPTASSMGAAELRQLAPREQVSVRLPQVPAAPARSTAPDEVIEWAPTPVATDDGDVVLRESQLPARMTAVLQSDVATASIQATPAARNPAAAGTAPATPPAVPSQLAATMAAGIDLPVQESGWDRAISERVLMMAGNRLQNAEIRLTPADLGPLRVQLAIEDGTATVNFSAQHVLTREAIEQALPRLREMLAETGLALGEASVGDEALDYTASRDTDSNNEPGALAEDDAVPASETSGDAPRSARVANGLVDTFV